MLYKSSFLSRCALVALAVPVVGFSAAVTGIQVATTNLAAPLPYGIVAGSTGPTCGYGSCTSAALTAGALTLGGSTSGGYNFNITASDGDIYNIMGTFNNTFPSNPRGGFFPTVTYEGNMAHPGDAVAQDTITFDMLQDFTVGSTANWSGNYKENLPLDLPNVAGSQASGQVIFSTLDSMNNLINGPTSVGELGPVFGTGNYVLSGSSNINPLSGYYLASDFQFTFVFPGGTATPIGGFISSPSSAVPEPAQTIPAAMGLVGLLLFKARKLRLGSAK